MAQREIVRNKDLKNRLKRKRAGGRRGKYEQRKYSKQEKSRKFSSTLAQEVITLGIIHKVQQANPSQRCHSCWYIAAWDAGGARVRSADALLHSPYHPRRVAAPSRVDEYKVTVCQSDCVQQHRVFLWTDLSPSQLVYKLQTIFNIYLIWLNVSPLTVTPLMPESLRLI